jgi:hypothetical protein
MVSFLPSDSLAIMPSLHESKIFLPVGGSTRPADADLDSSAATKGSAVNAAAVVAAPLRKLRRLKAGFDVFITDFDSGTDTKPPVVSEESRKLQALHPTDRSRGISRSFGDAEACHRFGCFNDLSLKQSRVQRLAKKFAPLRCI